MADAPKASLVSAILLGGVVAGTVDVGSASLIFHQPWNIILRAIASGLIGKAAAHGGGEIVALGLALQWGMSIIIATIYGVAAKALPMVSRRWPLWGLAYGVGVYVVMTYGVVPLSRATPHAQSPMVQAENVAAMLLFGLIVAFFARRLAPEKP